MRLYASTFVAGLTDVAITELKHALPDARVLRQDDGIALYETSASPAIVRSLRFANNSFAVLSLVDPLAEGDPLKAIAAAARQDEGLDDAVRAVLSRNKAYTILGSVANQLTAIPAFALQKLEKRLAEIGVRLDRQAKKQLWLVARDEGYGFFGLRLTGGEQYDAPLAKGELRPELAHLLCALSEPSADDVFLDPFAGSGAIPLERAAVGRYGKIFASDSDGVLVKRLEERVRASGEAIDVRQADALQLSHLADGSVSSVVTDPPWGHFADAIDLGAMLDELLRVTKPGGRIVLLLGRDAPFEEEVKRRGDRARLTAHNNILVSGKKASVHVLRVSESKKIKSRK